MATVTRFVQSTRIPKKHPSEVSCYWSVGEVDGRKLLQLDTYGSKDRQILGKQSQTLQLDKKQAEELFSILKQYFAFK